jgi:putative flippase GtrA
MTLSYTKKFFAGFDFHTEAFLSLFWKNKKTRDSVHQFIKFALIGFVNTFVDFGIYYLLTRHTSFFYYTKPTKYLANCISFLTATTMSFFANRAWTFGRRDRATLNEASRFYATTLSGLLINNGILFLLNHYFFVNDLVSKVFSTIFSTVWNFTFKKLWVFVPETDSTVKETI